MPFQTPTIEVAGSGVTDAGLPGNPAAAAFGHGYSDLLSLGSTLFAAGTSIKSLNIDAGTLASASYAKVGTSVDEQVVTKAMVDANRALLSDIAAYCRVNGIFVSVGAQLDNAPKGDWTYQWLEPAAAAGLPISAVENVDETDYSTPSAQYAATAANEALIVKQIAAAYPNVKIGQWEGASAASSDAWRLAYDAAAQAANLPTISYLVADTSWNAPWVVAPGFSGSWLTDISQDAHANGLSLKVLLGGIGADVTSQQWTAQSEQHAAALAMLPDVQVDALLIQSWQAGLPENLFPVNDPSTIGNDALEISAIYPLYAADLISARGATSIAVPAQLLGAPGIPTALAAASVDYDGASDGPDARLAVVLVAQTGSLSAVASGSGTATSINSSTIVLNGTAAQIAAELRSVSVTEAAGGLDTLDVEAFNQTGRASDTQIQVVTLRSGDGQLGTSVKEEATAAQKAWSSVSMTISAAGSASSLTYNWNPPSATPTGATGRLPARTISIHEPLAETGLSRGAGGWTVSAADPTRSTSAHLALGQTGWNPSAFDPSNEVSKVALLSTTLTYDAASSKLDTQTDAIAAVALDPTAPASAARDYLQQGGQRVTQFNTGSNPNWSSAWGSYLSSVSLIYGSGGQLLQQTFQGGVRDPWYTHIDVYDPHTGSLWEQIQSERPVAPFGGFATGTKEVTQFNTGNNPNWDAADWGAGPYVTVTWQDYYAVNVAAVLPAAHTVPSSTQGQSTSANRDVVPPQKTPDQPPRPAQAPAIVQPPPALADMPNSDGSTFLYQVGESHQSGTARGTPYQGPSHSLRHTFVTNTDDRYVLLAADQSSFIVDGGAGQSAFKVTGGDNVISTYRGSKFVVLDSDGNDQVFLNLGRDRPIWDTVASFVPSDSVTLWGFIAGTTNYDWIPKAGAAGWEGLTLVAHGSTGELGRVSFAGLGPSDIGSLKLWTGGTGGDQPFLRIDHT